MPGGDGEGGGTGAETDPATSARLDEGGAKFGRGTVAISPSRDFEGNTEGGAGILGARGVVTGAAIVGVCNEAGAAIWGSAGPEKGIPLAKLPMPKRRLPMLMTFFLVVLKTFWTM